MDDPLGRLEREYADRAEALGDSIGTTAIHVEALADRATVATVHMQRLGRVLADGFRREFSEIVKDLQAQGL
jgi:hypothetical protein